MRLPGYFHTPPDEDKKGDTILDIEEGVWHQEGSIQNEEFALPDVKVVNNFLNPEARDVLICELLALRAKHPGVNWSHDPERRQRVTKTVIILTDDYGHPATMNFPARVETTERGEVNIVRRDFHDDDAVIHPGHSIHEPLMALLTEVRRAMGVEIGQFYHLTVNFTADTHLPAHADEPRTDGPGRYIANVILTCGGDGDTSIVVFQDHVNREKKVRVIVAGSNTFYAFTGEARTSWTHAVYTSKDKPETVEEAIPRGRVRIGITVRGDVCPPDMVESFYRVWPETNVTP